VAPGARQRLDVDAAGPARARGRGAAICAGLLNTLDPRRARAPGARLRLPSDRRSRAAGRPSGRRAGARRGRGRAPPACQPRPVRSAATSSCRRPRAALSAVRVRCRAEVPPVAARPRGGAPTRSTTCSSPRIPRSAYASAAAGPTRARGGGCERRALASRRGARRPASRTGAATYEIRPCRCARWVGPVAHRRGPAIAMLHPRPRRQAARTLWSHVRDVRGPATRRSVSWYLPRRAIRNVLRSRALLASGPKGPARDRATRLYMHKRFFRTGLLATLKRLAAS